MSNNVNNPTKVITGPNTRWSYCNAWEAKATTHVETIVGMQRTAT